jgi:hypothetical protein
MQTRPSNKAAVHMAIFASRVSSQTQMGQQNRAEKVELNGRLGMNLQSVDVIGKDV